jgi:beta-lactamase regulating signal transducer with metallopeptidase domain
MMGAAPDYLFVPMAVKLALGILVKASVVLVIAWTATLFLRRRSAACRYAIWSSALAVLILLPALSTILPAWDFGPAPFRSMASSWSGQPERDKAAVPVRPDVESPECGAPACVTKSRDLDRPQDVAESPGIAMSRLEASPLNAGNLALGALVLWAVGTAVMLLRLAAHAVRAYGIIRRAPAEGDSELSSIAAPFVEALGISRPVRIVTNEEMSLPFSWGVWNPVVVLPSAAREWPAERKRSILLHELAHIARWDYFLHLLVEIVRSIYWPNPIVWFAARRNGVERERACDDFALLNGTPSEEYASHLVYLARTQLEATPVGALTMAGEPGFFERIRSVMNRRLDRSPLHPTGQLLTVGLALVIAAPLAALGTSETPHGAADAAYGASRTSWKIPTVGQLIGDMREAREPMDRQKAAWWLGEHEDYEGVAVLIEALGDASADVRLAAAWALGEIKDHRAITPLTRNLDDDDMLAREMAALALGEIEHPAAVDALEIAFDKQEELRPAVIWALGEIEGREARAARVEAFSRLGQTPWRNDEVWTGVLPLERSLPHTDDVPAVLDRLRDRDAEERRRAALTLGHVGIQDAFGSIQEVEAAVGGLLETLRDPVPTVRAAAVWALDEINPSRSKNHRH